MKQVLSVLIFLCAVAVGCSQTGQTPTELKRLALDNIDGVLTQTGVQLDNDVSSDGGGALKVTADGPTVVRLFELGDLNVEDARLFYQAKLRTENLQGRAYLEMWCHFPGKGDYFSRSVETAISGTTDWATIETPFFLQKGENPDNVKLNLVVEGSGIAWIDDIRLSSSPL